MNVSNLRTKISEHITTEQQIQKERNDKIRKATKKYAVDSLILVQITSEPATGGSKKLLPKYKRSFHVRGVLLNDRYEIEERVSGDHGQL